MKTALRAVLLTLAAMALLAPAAAMAVPPNVTTGAARDISPTAATVTGSVNPKGRVTTWYFQYGKTKNYGKRTTAQDAGAGTKAVKVSSGLTELTPNTTYHYRLVAINSSGSKLGADKTFKTPQTPTVSTIAAGPNPVVFGQPVVVSGFLVGPKGGGGKQVALLGRAFPFSDSYVQIGNTVVTAENGGYQFVFTPVITTELRVVDKSDDSIVSPALVEAVSLRTTLHATRRGRKGRARFSGTVTPAGNTAVVVIQRRIKGGWKNVRALLTKTGPSGTSSRYSRKISVRTGVFRAVARPNGGSYVEGVSRGRRVRQK
jgi:hypothetical protein